MPSTAIPAKISSQIEQALATYHKPLRDARNRNATEGDTGLLVSRMLTDMFGYDPFGEVTSEFKIKGQYVDFAIRDHDRIGLVIEVKGIGLRLTSQHLFQATSYAVHEGVEWAILTNAAQWDLYRITFAQPVEWHRVSSIDLIEDSPTVDDLVVFHKWGMARGLAEEQWQKMHALSPANLVKALVSEDVLKPLASLIKKSTGMRFHVDEIREHIVADVFRPGLIGEVGLAELPPTPGDQGPSETRRVRLKSLVTTHLIDANEEIIGEHEGRQARALFQADGTVLFAEQTHSNLYTLTKAAFDYSAGPECWEMWRRASGETLAVTRDHYLAR